MIKFLTGEKRMDILPPISNIKRNHPVSLPDATLFPKSIGVLAAGILLFFLGAWAESYVNPLFLKTVLKNI